MGYEFHITRAEHWLDSKAVPITLEEWIAYIHEDVEMRLDGFAEAHLADGEQLRVESPGIAVWLKWSCHNEPDCFAWIGWDNGEIIANNSDKEIRQKMFHIARRLGARVQGDDGEIYGEDGEIVPENKACQRTPWWKKMFT